MSNNYRKREAARQHNAMIDKHGHQVVGPRVIDPEPQSQRNAMAAQRDATSGHPNRTYGGRRMRSRAGSTLDSMMKGREKLNRLFARAGIRLGL